MSEWFRHQPRNIEVEPTFIVSFFVYLQYKADLVQSFSDVALPHFQSGKLRPIIDRVFPLDKLSEAHQFMEDNKNVGKILLKVLNESEPHSDL